MIVAVGSTNPTKTAPVRQVFSRHFKNVKVIGIKVDSGISEQPMSIDEMYKGALIRAKTAMKQVKNAAYGVGIEGGLHRQKFGWFEHSLIVITDRTGKTGVGSSGGLVLPDRVIDEIKKGKNLEEVIDQIFGTKKVGEGMGMFGIMTRGVVTRTSGVKHGVAFALAPFLHPKVYGV